LLHVLILPKKGLYERKYTSGSSENTLSKNLEFEMLVSLELHPFKMNTIKITISLVLSTAVSIFHANAYTVSGSTYTTNGSASDVQAAVNAAPAGSTVVIPTGSYSWTTGVTVSKNLTITGQSQWSGGSGAALTGGAQITNKIAGSADMILCNVSPGAPYMTISNLALLDGGTDTNYNTINFEGSGTPLLTGCYLHSAGGVNRTVYWGLNGGVAWNNTCYSNDGDPEIFGFEIVTANPGTSWQSPSTMGTLDTTGTNNTYIESNTFNNVILQSFDCADNSRVVIRYNTFNNSGGSSHGQDTSPNGCRQWEFYNNTCIFTTSGNTLAGDAYPLNMNWWALFRGGTGVILNNVFPSISSEQWGSKATIIFGDFNINQTPNAVPCQTVYPSARQIGQTWIGSGGYSYQTPGTAAVDGTGYGTDPVYIWGNTGTGATNVGYANQSDSDFSSSCGNGLNVANFIKSGRDYIVGTAKPGYTPYPYPHPLTSGSGTPAAPQDLRVTN
jgi:hypothetical protein